MHLHLQIWMILRLFNKELCNIHSTKRKIENLLNQDLNSHLSNVTLDTIMKAFAWCTFCVKLYHRFC